MINCTALPGLICLDQFRGDFFKYQDYLYKEIFKKQLYTKKIYFEGKPVGLKASPFFQEKEDSFYHLTCKDFHWGSEDREPDLRRSERLSWIKPSIETNHDDACKKSCFKRYVREYNNKQRIHLLDIEDRYIVILEERPTFYLLITAFYIEYDNQLNKKIKEYETYKQQETP